MAALALEVEEIIEGLVLYMRSDAFSKGLPGGKKWLKIDLKEAGKKAGVDLAQLQQLSGGSSDPTQFLTYLAKAGDVRKVGAEEINGIPTTHYHATIEFAKLAGSAGAAADSVRQLKQLSGLEKLPTDIWIDGDQHVRRQTVAISVQQPVATKFNLTIDYKRFGVPVDTTAPPADETADFADIAGG